MNLMSVTNRLMVTTVLLMSVVIGLLVYEHFVSLPFAFEILSSPIEVVKKEMKPGEKVLLISTQCNNSNKVLLVKMTRNLFNLTTDTLTILPDSEAEVPPGCFRVRYAVDTVPADLPSGDYVLFGRVFVPDWYHTHSVIWQSERFQVIR